MKDWVYRDKGIGVVQSLLSFEDGSIQTVSKDDLPIILPDDVDLNTPGNPLEKYPTWKFTKDKNGKKVRETDTLDTFVDFLVFFKILLS